MQANKAYIAIANKISRMKIFMDYQLTTKPWKLPPSNMYGIAIYNIATKNLKLLLHIYIYSSYVASGWHK